MCGIAGFYLKEPDFVKTPEDKKKMERFLNHLLTGIESRGHDATGFIAVSTDGKKMLVDKKDVTATEFIRTRKKLPDKTRIVLGHTRYVTKGAATNWFNNHPVGWKSVFITHNGTISNDDRLFRENKWTRHGQVDSEAIAALIANEGWDDIENLNRKLYGGYAVAALDLEKPGEVLLFKGQSWPLAYHDNPNFLVWASEAMTIQKAWGNVLGTPPTIQSFEHLGPGDAVRIKDGEVTLHEAPKSTSNRPHWETSYGEEEDWMQYGTCETPWNLERRNGMGTQSTSTPRVSNSKIGARNNAVQIALMRKDGLGKAITWEMRKAGDLTEEQLNKFSGKWEWCSSCQTSVTTNDIFATLAWGRICIDCHSFLSNPVNKGTEPEVSSTTALNELKMIDNLEDWVELESKIYYSALLTVSDATGLQTATIDYLLQRITPKELISNPKLRDLKDEIHVEFDSAENDAWKQYSEDSCAIGPRGKCSSYNQIDARCPGCEFCIVDAEEDGSEETGVQVFADTERDDLWVTCAAGTHTTYEQCDACDAGRPNYSSSAVKPVRNELKPMKALPPAPKTAEKSPNQCMTGKCRKKSKVVLVTSHGKLRWCYKHYSKCNVRGCQEATRGSDKDGLRLCHEHFRGAKGGLQDAVKRQHAPTV